MNDELQELHGDLYRGIVDMLFGGRLTEADIPDDYQWLTDKLGKINTALSSEFEE